MKTFTGYVGWVRQPYDDIPVIAATVPCSSHPSGTGLPHDVTAWERAPALMRLLQAKHLYPIGAGAGLGRIQLIVGEINIPTGLKNRVRPMKSTSGIAWTGIYT